MEEVTLSSQRPRSRSLLNIAQDDDDEDDDAIAIVSSLARVPMRTTPLAGQAHDAGSSPKESARVCIDAG
jgi:hypothetical protein